MTIGKRISKERREKNLSQEYIAERLGVSRQAVSKWETDQSSPDTNNLIALAELFDVSVEYLATGKVPETVEVQSAPQKPDRPAAKICGFIFLGVGLLALVLGVLFSELLIFLSLYMILIGVLCITIKKYLWAALIVTLALPELLYVSIFMVRNNAVRINALASPNVVTGSLFQTFSLLLIAAAVVIAVIIISRIIKKRKK